MERPIRINWILVIDLAVFAALMLTFVVRPIIKTWHTLGLMKMHNDARWITMALHHYHDTHGTFPPVVVRDDNGKALHSWRALIEPDLAAVFETDQNFAAYDLAEPWNSKTNTQAENLHRFGTHDYQFLALVGPHAAWTSTGTRTVSDFTDGTSQTVMVIAIRNTNTRWHEPEDITVHEDGSLTVRGQPLHLAGDVFVLLVDGSVRRVFLLPAVQNRAFSPSYSREAENALLGREEYNGLPREVLGALITLDGDDSVPEW